VAVVSWDPTDVWTSLPALIIPGQHIVRNIEVIRLSVGKIDAFGWIDGVVTSGAMFIQYGLYNSRIVKSCYSPLWFLKVAD
jgi:hypothetical protein